MDEPKRGNRIWRRLWGGCLFAGLLLAAVTSVWFWGIGRMEAELRTWTTNALAAGMQVSHGTPIRSGWPFAAALVLPDVSLTAEGPAGAERAVVWRAGDVRLAVRLWSPAILRLTLPASRIVAGGVAIAIDASRLRADVQLGTSGVVLLADNLRLGLPRGRMAVTHGRVQVVGTRLDVLLDGVSLPDAGLPFGGFIDAASLHGTTTVAPAPAAASPWEALAAWRDAGGVFTFEAAALHWGPLQATATGMLWLDAKLQPEGQADAHLVGTTALIEAMTRAGTIGRNASRVIVTLLGLMARPAPDGTLGVDLPLQLRGGCVSAGEVPLLQLSPLPIP